MPQFRHWEHYYGKRYVGVVKKRCGIQTFFSTTPYAAIPSLGTLLWKAVKKRYILETRSIYSYIQNEYTLNFAPL